MRKLWLLLFCAALLGASQSAVGTWAMESTVTGGGEENTWTLTIAEANGHLEGKLSGESGDYTLDDVKLNGQVLTFRVAIDDETYHVSVKIDGSKFEGAFRGEHTKGTLKGTRQS